MKEKFWTFNFSQKKSEIIKENNTIILKNGLVERTIDIVKGVTTSYKNLWKNYEVIKDLGREAAIGINGNLTDIGGENSSFTLSDVEIKDGTSKEFDWKPAAYSTHEYPYPALGKTLVLRFKGNIEITKDVDVILIYEIFDGMPLIRQSLNVETRKDITITFAETTHFILETAGEALWLESNYTGGNGSMDNKSCSVFKKENNVSVHFDLGPDIDVTAGNSFIGMQVYQILFCSLGHENRMNELYNAYRRVAPWVNESPIFMHLISDDSEKIRKTADEISEVGYEMIIQSFGSDVNLESTDEEYIDRVKSDYDYVHSKGLKIGGYTLSIVRDYSPMNHDCALDGDHSSACRCLKTKWAKEYKENYINFLKKTGSDFIEIDGPYHFSTCTGNKEGQTEHLHKGLSDSRYTQWIDFTYNLYIELKNMGIYVNAPDWFYLSGTNKSGVGYEEIAFSQPRIAQLALNRIYNYMGTYNKIPSMGWGFLPIDEYHGGGEEAKFEPLNKNIAEYDWAMAEWIASGVQPCVRGNCVYDDERTKKIVKYWLDVLKAHRTLLNSNTVHVLPATLNEEDMRKTTDIDIIMQATDLTDDKAFIMVFNQTERRIAKTLIIPMYHTGLTNLVEPPKPPIASDKDNVNIPSFGSWPPSYPKIKDDFYEDYRTSELTDTVVKLYENDITDDMSEYKIDSNGNITMEITLEPLSYTYFVAYSEKGKNTPDIVYPIKRDFSLKIQSEKDILPESKVTINYDAVSLSKTAQDVIEAMGLPRDNNAFNGNKVILSREAYDRIHTIVKAKCTDPSGIMFALAQYGMHTDAKKRIPNDEVWLLEGAIK